MDRARPPARFPLLAAACLAGCGGRGCGGPGGGGADTGASPWTDTASLDFTYDSAAGGPDSAYLPEDSGDGEVDPRVRVQQAGAWTGSPAGGPWTALEGWFSTSELLHGGEAGCAVVWTVSGAAAASACPDCAGAWRLGFALESGAPEDCLYTDLPADGAEQTYGWAPDQGLVYLDHLDLGAWVPWLDGSAEGDVLSVAWDAAIAQEDE
jgi:hypothetical protein